MRESFFDYPIKTNVLIIFHFVEDLIIKELCYNQTYRLFIHNIYQFSSNFAMISSQIIKG